MHSNVKMLPLPLSSNKGLWEDKKVHQKFSQMQTADNKCIQLETFVNSQYFTQMHTTNVHLSLKPESQLHLHFDSDLSVKVHLFLQYRSCHKVDWWFIMVLSLSPFASNSLQFEDNLLWLQAIKTSFSAYSSSLTLFPLLQI